MYLTSQFNHILSWRITFNVALPPIKKRPWPFVALPSAASTSCVPYSRNSWYISVATGRYVSKSVTVHTFQTGSRAIEAWLILLIRVRKLCNANASRTFRRGNNGKRKSRRKLFHAVLRVTRTNSPLIRAIVRPHEPSQWDMHNSRFPSDK